MPLLNESSVGAMSVTSPVLSQVDTNFVFTVPIQTPNLFVEQLPKLSFYIVQIAGANPLTITPQVALRSVNGGLQPDLIWFDLSAPVIMPALNVPLLLNFDFPSQFARLSFNSPNATQSVRYVISAYSC